MTDKFVAGEEFSTGYRFEFEQCQPLEDRFSVFEKKFHNKNVLHIGCVDHLPVIERKMKKNVWVHNRIAQVSRKCIGFDINGPGITALRRMNIDDVYEFDVCSGQHESTKGESWDYMFMGEVLEHIDNPVSFLADILDAWKGRVKKIVLTVPNAFNLANRRNSRSGFECINSDHRYWFTPFTISKVLYRGGYQNPITRFITGFPPPAGYKIKSIRKRWRLTKFPALRDTLLAEAEF